MLERFGSICVEERRSLVMTTGIGRNKAETSGGGEHGSDELYFLLRLAVLIESYALVSLCY